MPDAPAPTFDSQGNLVAEWNARLAYDALRDRLTLTLTAEAGPYSKSRREERHYDPSDVETALADLSRLVRIHGARRLF